LSRRRRRGAHQDVVIAAECRSRRGTLAQPWSTYPAPARLRRQRRYRSGCPAGPRRRWFWPTRCAGPGKRAAEAAVIPNGLRAVSVGGHPRSFRKSLIKPPRQRKRGYLIN
jgi:hypothetical protein